MRLSLHARRACILAPALVLQLLAPGASGPAPAALTLHRPAGRRASGFPSRQTTPAGTTRVRRAFTQRGITVLENEALELKRGAERFFVVGLADPLTRRVRMDQALGPVPDGAPFLVLCHEPDVFPDVPDRAALTLAGHTHGGQVRLPLLGSLVVPSQYGQRYARGHVEENGRHLFVTSGVGTSIFPVRFGVPPEIALLTLR